MDSLRSRAMRAAPRLGVTGLLKLRYAAATPHEHGALPAGAGWRAGTAASSSWSTALQRRRADPGIGGNWLIAQGRAGSWKTLRVQALRLLPNRGALLNAGSLAASEN